MNIKEFKKVILSNKEEISEQTIKVLLKNNADEVVNFLIELLNHHDPLIRNQSAFILYDIKDERAKQPLLKAIFKKGNQNYNGTLVYSLSALNCEDLLVELFKILFHESDEAKMSANSILNKQEFLFTQQDLFTIREMWNNYNTRLIQEKRAENDEWELSIKETYESFIEYLVEENKTN